MGYWASEGFANRAVFDGAGDGGERLVHGAQIVVDLIVLVCIGSVEALAGQEAFVEHRLGEQGVSGLRVIALESEMRQRWDSAHSDAETGPDSRRLPSRLDPLAYIGYPLPRA